MVTIQRLIDQLKKPAPTRANTTLYLERRNIERMKALYGRKLSQAVDKLIEEHLGQVEKEKAP